MLGGDMEEAVARWVGTRGLKRRKRDLVVGS